MKRLALLALALATTLASQAQTTADGTKDHPLRVLLIPADGGTESGTKADYAPVFNAITRTTGLNFDIKVGQSYGAVVEGMCNQLADIAFFGPVAYVQAHQRNCAQLLAVGVEGGASVYYAGMFTKANSPLKVAKDPKDLQELKGQKIAFGDINSASSFTFQMAMILDAGLNPVRDLAAIRMTGSHANSLAALVQGQVDVASLSFDSYEKAVNQGAVDPKLIKVIAKSIPIPYPPLAMNTKLSEPMKAKLKEAFATVHKAPGVTPDMIRGYGGKKVDAFDTTFSEDQFKVAAEKLALIDDALKGEILKKASER
ncbi:MAG: putative phosphonate transporter, phosphonate-binding protein [Rhizobacter sp.]|nr:putative phosphonate transporter, phosphonate-binding protein [Rhizobacter sp.]